MGQPQQPAQQPAQQPFSVVLHYLPDEDRTLIVPIGVNLPIKVFLRVLDTARTEAIRAEIREQERAAVAKASEDAG